MNRHRWQTRDELHLAILIWIEMTCHPDACRAPHTSSNKTLNQAAHAASQRPPDRVNRVQGMRDRGLLRRAESHLRAAVWFRAGAPESCAAIDPFAPSVN